VRPIKQWIAESRERKNCTFDDLNKIAKRCQKRYDFLFPKYKLKKDGSSFVHHFNVPGVEPISLEKEHGSREYVPKFYAKLAIRNLEALVEYIEANTTPAKYSGSTEDDDENESQQNDTEAP
jgi:hypothetical protein